MKENWQDTLLKVLLADTSSLRELARIAGCDPKTFYRTADFTGVDMSKIDARGVVLPPSSRRNQDEVEDGFVRLVLTINPLIHFLMKRGNPGTLSAHVNVLIRVFLEQHLSKWGNQRARSRELETQLTKLVLNQGRVQGLSGIVIDRRLVTYQISESLKHTLLEACRRHGIGFTEMARIAVLYCLLQDPVRSFRTYRQSAVEHAVSDFLEGEVRLGRGKFSVVGRVRKGRKTYIQIRSLNEGLRLIDDQFDLDSK